MKNFKNMVIIGSLAITCFLSEGIESAFANGETYNKYYYTTVGGVEINGQSVGYVKSTGYGDTWGYSHSDSPIDVITAINYVHSYGILRSSDRTSKNNSTSAWADPADYIGTAGNFKSQTYHYFSHNGSEKYFYTEYSF